MAAQDIRGQPGTSGGGSTGHPGWQWICFGFMDKPRYSDEEDDAARWEQQIPWGEQLKKLRRRYGQVVQGGGQQTIG